MEAETMGWQWHQLDHMQVICTSLQTNNHASSSSLEFLQAGCSDILVDSSTGSPVHILMLSIQAIRGLPRLHTPGILPCIIISRQFPCGR